MVAVANFLLVLIFALIPSLVWLAFFLKEDARPEPKRLIIYVFSVGALVSVPVLVLQLILQKISFSPFYASIILVFGFALVEEIFKFFAAYWSIRKEPAFDEPVDAMIYVIVAALGFATIENLFIVGDKMHYLTLGNLISGVSVTGFRFVGATLLHGLTSALAGYYWALGRKIGKAKKFIFRGLAVATLIHFVFNLSVRRFESFDFFYPALFLIFIAFFVFNDFSKLKKNL